MCSFPDVRSAVTTSVQTLQSAIPIARMEFLNELSLLATNRYFSSDYPVAPTLFMEFTGSERAVQEQAEAVGEEREEGGKEGVEKREAERGRGKGGGGEEEEGGRGEEESRKRKGGEREEEEEGGSGEEERRGEGGGERERVEGG